MGYTEAIEKLHEQLAFAKGGPAAALQLQLHEARNLYQKLQMEMQDSRTRLEELQQHAPKGSEPSAESAAAGQALREEISQLRTSIGALQGDEKMNSQRNQIRDGELRRLRNDVDMLNSEKEALE